MSALENSALQEAAERDDVNAVRSLLDGGADPNAAGMAGRTPLCSTSSKEIIELLLARGANPNLAQSSGMTPLEVAVLSVVPLEIIEMLMKAGADPHFIGVSGCSILTYACKQSSVEKIKTLIRCGADVNRADSQGLTPLQAAKRRPDVQMLLREAGAKA